MKGKLLHKDLIMPCTSLLAIHCPRINSGGGWQNLGHTRLKRTLKKKLDLPANTTKEDDTAISKEELLADMADIKEALQEVKLSKEGKIKLKSAWDLLDEL